MKKIINLLIVLIFILQNSFFAYAEGVKLNKSKQIINQKQIKNSTVPDVSFGAEDSSREELIQVSVRNEFDEEIKVKFDTNREYPIGSHESISLGQRKPGKYTLTVYNKKGEFIDNLTKNIDLKNKFILNKDTVSNSDKITGLTTGQKVAITAGALGAAAVGGVLLNNALQQNNQDDQSAQYIPPPAVIPEQNLPQVQVSVPPQTIQPQVIPEQPVVQENQIAPIGKAVKFLNTKYPQVTVIVEGSNGNPIGNNWVIPVASLERKPQPLVFNSVKITINPEQKIKSVLPNGFELQRYGFELEIDSIDNSYVWVLK